jgi:hypothetical protein
MTNQTATTRNDLVKVAYANDQVEAEFVQMLLEEAGIGSVVRRAPGFDVPDFLAAGPREVLVAGPDAADAREALAPDGPVRPEPFSATATDPPRRVLAALLLAVALVAAVVCVGVDVLV